MRWSCVIIPRLANAIWTYLKWGLLRYFTKDPVHAKRPINARADTGPTLGKFKAAFARRRCLVPADAFYE